MIKLHDSASRGTNRLDTLNPEMGFENAIANGQQRLALEYALLVIRNLRRDVQSLQEAIAVMETQALKGVVAPEPPQTEPSPERRTTRRKNDTDPADQS